MDDKEKEIRRKLKNDFRHYSSKCLKIRTKSGKVLPFELNVAQQHVHKQVEHQKLVNGKVRAIILKGRQQGISTYIEGRLYWLVTHRKGVRAFILTHEAEATNNLFEMAMRYHEHCPLAVRPNTDASSAKELSFGKLDSGYKVGTAGNKGVGRSSTIQFLHGCLAKGTKIYNPDTGGIKNIEDFKIGDKIKTHNDNIALVSFISTQEKYCISIKLRTHTSIPLVATKTHRFWTKNGWVELENLRIGDEIGYPVSKITDDIKTIDLPPAPIRIHGGGRQNKYPDSIELTYEFGLIVGLYLAEGNIKLQSANKNNYPASISFTVHRKEVDRTVKWLLPFKDYYSNLHVKNRESSLTSTITIYGNRFSQMMNELCGRVKNKHVPLSWRLMSENFCTGLLHGYISGDGSSYSTDRRVRASSIHSAISIPIRDVAAALGYGWGGIAIRDAAIRNGRNEKTQYIFSLCGDGANKLAKEIGKPFPKLQRKKVTSKKEYAATATEISNGYAWLRIRSIENIGLKEVYDFEIDHPDHSYCTIQSAVHNSEVAFWPNASEHSKGVMQAVPNEPGTEIYLESTANGVGNYFHEQWQLAESGESDFIPIFIPWYWQPEYVRDVPENFHPNEDEVELIKSYKINALQLMWRRYKIQELSAAGANGVKAFQQEYPNNPSEAFSLSGEDTYIQPDLVTRARNTKCEGVGALIVGVDPARFGDDRTSIIFRRGRQAYNLRSYTKKDTMEVVGIVHKIIKDYYPDMVNIDVGGLGAGVVDRLVELGYGDIINGINAGSTALDIDTYSNKRAEMWGELREWLTNAPCELPNLDTLHADLCGIKYKFDSNSRLVIEPKDQMKKRGLRSPDEADALCLTFAVPIKAVQARKNKSESLAKEIMYNSNNLARLRSERY